MISVNVDEKPGAFDRATQRGEATRRASQDAGPRAHHGLGLLQNLTRRQRVRRFVERADQDRIRADLATFFGPDSAAYLSFYEKRRTHGGAWVWSWSWAFIPYPYAWHFYRKMYVLGVCTILVLAVLVVWNPVLAGLSVAGLAVTAKPAYINTALRRIGEADALGLTGAGRDRYLRSAGGTSALAATLSVLVVVVALYGAYLGSRGFVALQELF